VGEALAWLASPSRLLAFRNDLGKYQLTALGLAATRSTLPAEIAAGFGQLIRDVLEVDANDTWLAQWTPLDHLIVLECLSDRSPSIRRFGKNVVSQVDSWMEEQRGSPSLLFRNFILGEAAMSRAEQLLGSLGMSLNGVDAWEHAYLAVLRSIVLHERGRGISVTDLERRWSIKNLGGVEEKWRDNQLWLLSAIAKILDTRCFFFCLKETCGADANRCIAQIRSGSMTLTTVSEATTSNGHSQWRSANSSIVRGWPGSGPVHSANWCHHC
jgi:hypothetical protein